MLIKESGRLGLMSAIKKAKLISERVHPGIKSEVLAISNLVENDPKGAILRFSSFGLILCDEIFKTLHDKRPSSNLYECTTKLAGINLNGQALLPQSIQDHLNTIRKLSNRADHAVDYNKNYGTFSKADAEYGLELIVRTLEWFYCDYENGLRLNSLYNKSSEFLNRLDLLKKKMPLISLRWLIATMVLLLLSYGIGKANWFNSGFNKINISKGKEVSQEIQPPVVPGSLQASLGSENAEKVSAGEKVANKDSDTSKYTQPAREIQPQTASRQSQDPTLATAFSPGSTNFYNGQIRFSIIDARVESGFLVVTLEIDNKSNTEVSIGNPSLVNPSRDLLAYNWYASDKNNRVPGGAKSKISPIKFEFSGPVISGRYQFKTTIFGFFGGADRNLSVTFSL